MQFEHAEQALGNLLFARLVIRQNRNRFYVGHVASRIESQDKPATARDAMKRPADIVLGILAFGGSVSAMTRAIVGEFEINEDDAQRAVSLAIACMRPGSELAGFKFEGSLVCG
ncbi:hypothetical protein [Erythrobacter sp.]|uniref:hypothetical protein n=1 Tax=Erythrobacter sp. TaxID=1042 RepID=UPI0025F84325|nr:hypothetical protein [Erythrobacter sp.]